MIPERLLLLFPSELALLPGDAGYRSVSAGAAAAAHAAVAR